MNIKWKIPTAFLLLFLCLAISQFGLAQVVPAKEKQKFPDFRDDPAKVKPPYEGKVFRLRQDYPETLPPAEVYPWKQFHPKKQWREYLTSVLDYCLYGNVDCDWVVQNGQKRDWYHAPWLHWGPNGREFVHGLTHERVSLPGELATSQVSQFQNWAVGFYNAPGGYIIGQIWRDPDKAVAANFPDGTVSVKLLFTQATVDEVPYLKGAKEWDAHIYQSIAIPTNARLPRKIKTVRLLQIDVAVRDTQVDDKSGWVFGTFTYNGNQPGSSPWDKMVPVGLMFGNDEGLTIAKERAGQVPQESAINPGPEVPFQHLGYAGRLNGPVDNPISSCLSCHSTAQRPATDMVPPREYAIDSPDWLRWFRTLRTDVPFTPGDTSLGYSLQLASGLNNYSEWRASITNIGGHFAEDPSKPKVFPLDKNGNRKPHIQNLSREGLPN